MVTRIIITGLFALIFVAQFTRADAQSRIPGAPSNAPPIGVDVTGRAEDIGDKIQNVFENVDMVANYVRGERINTRLSEYLTQMGAKPTLGQIHLFYVQALVREDGQIDDLVDFQYLTQGKTTVDALRESFALETAPGTEDRIDPTRSGTRLEGIYVTARSDGGKFAFTGGSLTKDFYWKIRQEGLALRDQRTKERAEAERIERIKAQRRASHAANDEAAKENLRRDRARGPLPPGPASFPPGAPPDRASPIGLPPTRTGPRPDADAPSLTPPAAHPRVRFDHPTVPLQTTPPPVGVRPPG